jgi:sulfatase maturation enzyme AslB (radical SAM superfamily)
MCNVWKIRPGKDINLQDLSVYLKDPIFSKIRSVGINGGEPSLFKELPELVKIILELPRLKSINIISNGFLSENFLYNCEEINNNCKENKIRFHISISLDGVEAIHDKIRGVKGAYERTIKTIQILQKNKNRYCDTYDIGCTITKYNIFYLNELLALSELKHLPIFFRLAVANLRIDSQNSYRDYGVLTENRYKMTAQEFFFGMFLRAHNLSEKFKYFAIYHYLYNNGLDRLSQCTWQNRDITLDDSGNLYYCAVERKNLVI